jgi:hypothetical protein
MSRIVTSYNKPSFFLRLSEESRQSVINTIICPDGNPLEWNFIAW